MKPDCQARIEPRRRRHDGRYAGAALLAWVALVACRPAENPPASAFAGEVEHNRAALAQLSNGLSQNNLGPNGIAFNHVNPSGLAFNGVQLNLASLNLASLNLASRNLASLNLASLNGAVYEDIWLNTLSFDAEAMSNASLNAASLSDATLSTMKIDGQPISALEADDVENIIKYLAECALVVGQCVTVTRLDGTTQDYCGLEGHDPTWNVNVPDLTKSADMGECFVRRAGADGHTATHEPWNIEATKILLQYMVECALSPGQSATIYDIDGVTPMVFEGSLGLAPSWRDGAPTSVEQRKVSACLAARSNAKGKKVRISLRGSGITTSAVERAHFDTHEGAFWGDVFGPTPEIHTCMVTGGGLSGRTCTEGDCGFRSLGDCADVCSQRDPVDLAYGDCDGESAVINTFLDLGQELAFGDEHNCFIRNDGTLWCWGKNNLGQLGLGFVSDFEPYPLQVMTLSGAVAEVSGGWRHTCARTTSGDGYCWGLNSKGQLGDGTIVDRSKPTYVSALSSDVAAISANDRHSCARRTDGTLHCWGNNDFGQVGDGSGVDQPLPVPVSALGNQVSERSLGSRSRSSCAITISGDLYCWGRNDYGQVGDGSLVDRLVPVVVDQDAGGGAFGAVTDVCGGEAHTCARRSDGTVWCWGQDSQYQIGAGAPTLSPRPRPVQTAFPGFAAPGGLSCGRDHTCAIRDDGALFCWGANDFGEVGDGTSSPAEIPTQVTALGTDVELVTCQGETSCAVSFDGTLSCWGRDTHALLFPGWSSSVPVVVDLACNHNAVCEPEHAESCDTCAADCGVCDTARVSLAPSDDTEARAKKPDTSYGGQDPITSVASALAEERLLLRFDLSAAPGSSVSQAILRLYSNDPSGVCDLVRIDDDGWSEDTLTWNDMPAPGVSLGAVSGVAGGWVYVDVTDYVSDEYAGDGVVSFACVAQSGTFSIASKEDAAPAVHPVLDVDVTP
ncbi:DUF7594 domain-containing protein [Haliangium sp.]|uniref:RCC1 domain-containing protein n=1 Tax=Haliangium sp. TaxID=2663208 RepID=UPI003D09DE07